MRGVIGKLSSSLLHFICIQTLQRSYGESMKLLSAGANVFYVDKWGIIMSQDAWEEAMKRPDITPLDAEALRRGVGHASMVVAMAGSQGGHWVYDAGTGSLFVSPTLNQMFGLDPDTPAASHAEYFGRIVAAAIIGISIVIAAAIYAGVMAALY